MLVVDERLTGKKRGGGILCYMIYLLCRDEKPEFGSFALGDSFDLDERLNALGWLLPDHGIDFEIEPNLIAYAFCGCEQEGDKKIQRLARWMANNPINFETGEFQLHCYKTSSPGAESMVRSSIWVRPEQISGSSKVVQLRMA